MQKLTGLFALAPKCNSGGPYYPYEDDTMEKAVEVEVEVEATVEETIQAEADAAQLVDKDGNPVEVTDEMMKAMIKKYKRAMRLWS